MPSLGFMMWLAPSLPARTVVFGHHLRAPLTLHRATPVKFTVTAADHLHASLLHSQAAIAAQSAAAHCLPLGKVLASMQTLPALSFLQAQALVLDAVVWGILQVDELRRGDAAESAGPSVVSTVASFDPPLVHFEFLRLVMLDLQVVADVSEVRQLHPAGLDAAALRHAMAPTDALHSCLHRLLKTEKIW